MTGKVTVHLNQRLWFTNNLVDNCLFWIIIIEQTIFNILNFRFSIVIAFLHILEWDLIDSLLGIRTVCTKLKSLKYQIQIQILDLNFKENKLLFTLNSSTLVLIFEHSWLRFEAKYCEVILYFLPQRKSYCLSWLKMIFVFKTLFKNSSSLSSSSPASLFISLLFLTACKIVLNLKQSP